MPASSAVTAKAKSTGSLPHEHRPHLMLLAMANLVLLGSSLLTHNRDLMFSIALVVCVTMTLTYLFIWNRIARN